MKIRERVVHIPVVVSSGSVGPVIGGVLVAALVAVLVAVVVGLVYPSPTYQPSTSCAFCTPTTAAATTPPAEFPFGGEQR